MSAQEYETELFVGPDPGVDMNEFYLLTFVIHVDAAFYGRYCHDSELSVKIYNFADSNNLLILPEVEMNRQYVKFTVKRPCKQGEGKNGAESVMCADLVNKLRGELADTCKIEVTVMRSKLEHCGTYEQY